MKRRKPDYSQGLNPRPVIGPRGEILTIESLPKADQRWTIGRKAIIVHAVSGGLVTRTEVLERYPGLSGEELQCWMDRYLARGQKALRTTFPPPPMQPSMA